VGHSSATRVASFFLCLGWLVIALTAEQAWTAGHCDAAVGTGALRSITGQIEIQQATESIWRPARLNQEFCVGDTIRVASHSRALVIFDDGWIGRFDQNSSMRFVQSSIGNQRAVLNLLNGTVLFFSRISRSLDVVTPYVDASVEGTEFMVRVEAERTDVTVLQGRVSTANSMGRLALNAGQSAFAAAGKAPEPRLLVKPRNAAQWSIYYPPLLAALDGRTSKVPAEIVGPARQSLQQAAKGDMAGAIASLNSVAEADRDAQYFFVRAALLLAVGQSAEALDVINRALILEPEEAMAFALRAIVRVTQNQVGPALEDAARGVELRPDSAAARIALSYAQQANFELDAARDTLLHAISSEPENPLARARLAELWLTLGYRDRSLEVAQEAVALEPNLARVQIVLGFAALAEYRTRVARGAFERAITLNSADPLPRLGLGLAKIYEGDLDEGRLEIETAVALDSGNALLRAYLGKAYFEERRAPLDAEQFAMAKDIDPNDPTAYLYDGIRLQTENRPVEALKSLQNSVARNEQRAVYRSRLQLDQDRAVRATSLARAYDDLGFTQPGINSASRSLADDPVNTSAHRFLSDVYRGVRRKEIARVSELLQAQLMQDININPVQPSTSETNLNIVSSGGPSQVGANEFTPLFEREQTRFGASGFLGNQGTVGGEAILSTIYKRLSVSAGMYHFDSEGFRANNYVGHNIANVYAQLAATPSLNLQAEFRRRETDFGSLELNFDPEQFSARESRVLDKNMGRIGLRYSPRPGSDLLVSVIYNERDESRGGLPLDFRASDEGYQAEAQYIYRRDRFNLTAGLASADVDRVFEFSANQFNTVFRSESRISHPRGYAYANLSYPSVVWTLGLSYDNYEEGALDLQEINPKFGIQWNVLPNLRLRAVLFDAVKPALVSNRTIEPTQIAGFNQVFDDVNATKSSVYGMGLDWTAARNVILGVEAIRRDLELPVFVNSSVVSEKQDEEIFRAYVNWAPTSRLAFNGEYVVDRFEAASGLVTNSGRFPAKLEATRVPLSARYFHPNGVFVGLGATYVDQTTQRSQNSLLADGNDEFVVVDASVGIRLPGRRGSVSLDAKNLLDKEFSYQDDGFREFADEPSVGPYLPARAVLLQVSLSF